MSIQKTPVALIQTLDSEQKVTNYEVEFIRSYVGDDPEMSKAFQQTRVREEVSVEEFETYAANAVLAGDNACAALDAEVAALKERIAVLQKEHATQLQEAVTAYNEIVAQCDAIATKLDGLLKGIAEQLIPFAKQ